MILNLGKGTQLSKLDLQNAYTMVPVHLEDRPLLGIRWRGAVYLDTALPFGLRSVPKIFSAVVDTERGELHLPANKLIRLQQTIRYWVSKRSCTKRELVSLIGQLQHAATVVRQGRTFLRRMIDLAACFSRLDYHIRLNAQFPSDLQWWSLFLPD